MSNKDIKVSKDSCECCIVENDDKVIEQVSLHAINKTYHLKGLDCANCANKIIKELRSFDGVLAANIDLVNEKLNISFDKSLKDTIDNLVLNSVNKYEEDVKVINEDEHEHDHNHDFSGSKKEIVRIILAIVIFIIGLVVQLPEWIKFSVFLVSYLTIGWDILLKAIKNIIKGQVFDENFLMTIATVGAFIIHEYAEGVAVMLFYQVGELFQSLAVNRSRKSITSLMDIRPDYANLVKDDKVEKVKPEEVNINDFILVKPGEKVPLDGIIVDGNSFLDTSALSGESLPREVSVNSIVLSGSINKNGLIKVKVTKHYGDSTVAKILDLVQHASSKKAKTENFITKFARYYTPFVVITALLITILPPLLIPGATFNEWIYRALIFLVISCPCALVISIPLSYFGGIGGASRRGILVKGGNYLEALNNINTVVFDKTGTLTKGIFKVTKIVPKNEFSEIQLLKMAAYAEVYSSHPIAKSILIAYDKDVDKNEITSYEEIAGYGVKVTLNKRVVLAGNEKLMKMNNIQFNQVDSIGSVIHVSLNAEYVGYIVISDEVKEDAKLTIDGLKELAIESIMLTGDSYDVGKKVGNELGIARVYAELLPHDKVERIETINQNNKGNVVFVGDGINDAPVLARADIGVAMGGLGSDAAIEAADIVIMNDEPRKIITAIKIAKRTRRIVWQNIIFALGVKFIFLALGAFGIASMWAAVFADVGVSIIAIMNATRVMRVNKI